MTGVLRRRRNLDAETGRHHVMMEGSWADASTIGAAKDCGCPRQLQRPGQSLPEDLRRSQPADTLVLEHGLQNWETVHVWFNFVTVGPGTNTPPGGFSPSTPGWLTRAD